MLECGSCKNKIISGSKFCSGCGSPAPAEPADTASIIQAVTDTADTAETAESQSFAKKKRGLKLPVTVAVTVAVITAVTLGVNHLGLWKSPAYDRVSDLAIFAGDEEVAVVYANGSTVKIEGEYYRNSSAISMNGKKAAFLVDRDYDSRTGTLYYINGKIPIKVADDVHDFKLADSGDGLIYWQNHDERYNIADLLIFNGDSSALIHVDAVFWGYASDCAVISPDGRTVFYTADLNDDETSTFISTNGGVGEEFHADVTPIAIADKAKHIYYVNKDGRFVVQNGIDANSDTRLSSEGAGYGFFLNKDYSQIVVNTGDAARISIGGEDTLRISPQMISEFVIPCGAQSKYDDHTGGYIYGFDDFKNKVFQTHDTGLYLIDKNYERGGRFTAHAQYVTMSSDEKRLFFMDSGRLRTVSATNTDSNVITLSGSARNYAVGSGGYVYYVDSRNNLVRKKAAEDAEEVIVSENVYNDSLTSSSNGTVFFLTDYYYSRQEGTLYFTNGVSKHKVRDDVEEVLAVNSNVYYFTDSGGGFSDVYRSPANGRFAKVVSDIRHLVDLSYGSRFTGA